MLSNKSIAFFGIIGFFLVVGCTTTVKTPTTTINPPPLEAFSKFSRFELKAINTTEKCNKQEGGDQLLVQIQNKLNVRLAGLIENWEDNRNEDIPDRKLVIEPICSDAKLVGTASRVWGGALAGSSAVVMNVRYTEEESGTLIAEPVFYQRAQAIGAAWTFGHTDRDMVDRIVNLIIDYTANNYKNPVGGPTGLQQ